MTTPVLKSASDKRTMEIVHPVRLLQDDLERLERDLIAALYNVWRLTGKQKKIIRLDR